MCVFREGSRYKKKNPNGSAIKAIPPPPPTLIKSRNFLKLKKKKIFFWQGTLTFLGGSIKKVTVGGKTGGSVGGQETFFFQAETISSKEYFSSFNLMNQLLTSLITHEQIYKRSMPGCYRWRLIKHPFLVLYPNQFKLFLSRFTPNEQK